MKVLIFMTQFYQLSGAELLDVQLAEELNRRGIQADIISMYTPDLPGVEEATRDLRERGVPAVHFLGLPIHPPPGSLFPAIMRLSHLIREQGYAVIETSMLMPTVIASWATRGMQTRHVAGVHRVYRSDRDKGLSHMLLRFSLWCNKRTRYYAISDFVLNHWIGYSGVYRRHTRKIFNAISESYFNAIPDRQGIRKELMIPEEAIVIMCVGRLAKIKAADVLLEALVPFFNSLNMYLLYVGTPDINNRGTKEMLQRIERMIDDGGVRDRVRFLGYRRDVPRLMASSDLLAHPTRAEGFGLVLAEAMATGLPIVATDAEAIPEILTGTDAILVPPDDPVALRDGIIKTLSRGVKEKKLARDRGRKRAGDFRISTRTDLMIRLFHDVWLNRF